jgi:hypothetical protein
MCDLDAAMLDAQNNFYSGVDEMPKQQIAKGTSARLLVCKIHDLVDPLHPSLYCLGGSVMIPSYSLEAM